MTLSLNCTDCFTAVHPAKYNMPFGKALRIAPCFAGEFTEFRLWKDKLSLAEIKDCIRTPLSIVAEKRKKLRMKLKEKKSKEPEKSGAKEFSLDKKEPVGLDWGIPL